MQEIDVIDDYVSLIWTERFDELGDFQLVMPATKSEHQMLELGTMLGSGTSKRVMIIEKIEILTEDGDNVIKYSGNSIESFLGQRVGQIEHQSGSLKTMLNRLIWDGMIFHRHADEDDLGRMNYDRWNIYPPSTIPPTMTPPPFENSGWYNILDAHKKTSEIDPIGFRIVRQPFSGKLYYSNYTGNDLTAPGTSNNWNVPLTFTNYQFYEPIQDVEVWRNLSINQGFTNGKRALANAGYLDIAGTPPPKEVAVDWSVSKRGLEVISDAARNNGNATAAVMTSYPHPLNTMGEPALQPGYTWAGKTLTVSAKIEIKVAQSGTIHPQARRIAIFASPTTAWGFNDTPWAVSNQAPNVTGIHNVSVTFTLPTSSHANKYWVLALYNGNGVTDKGVIWGDLCILEAPKNPIGYFDYSYSPDTDLVASWSPDGKEQGILSGKLIDGTGESQFRNCIVIQSKQWLGATGGVSARMISKSGTANPEFVMNLEGNYARGRIWQSKVLAGTDSAFGKAYLYRNGAAVATGPTKSNTANNVYTWDLNSGSTKFDELVLRGNYLDYGQSLWYDNIIAANNERPTLVPRKAVVFSEDLGSFATTQSVSSIGGYKNVAYVTRGNLMVAIDDGYPGEYAFRRVIHVPADSVPSGPNMYTEMEALGMKALAENKRVVLIEGSVPANSRYVYDEDYSLGDIVTVQNAVGQKMFARVVEQVFVTDQNGSVAYPTVREEKKLVTGTWTARQYNIIWNSAEPLGTWSTQP